MPARADAADEEVLHLLERSDLEILGLLPRSSNYTFLARAGGRDDVLVVYKPRAGEAPLWDFPQGTLCQREVAAYRLSRALGFPSIPPTVLRDGPKGPGSAQLFRPFDPDQHYFTLTETRSNEFRPVAVFDAVANNADRKAGHCLLSREGDLFFVDHGVCFHRSPKLRTVIWEFAGQPLDPPLVEALSRLCTDLERPALAGELTPLLSTAELAALRRRVERVLSTGTFPAPGSERPYPWPVV
jgi:hypothetical protein